MSLHRCKGAERNLGDQQRYHDGLYEQIEDLISKCAIAGFTGSKSRKIRKQLDALYVALRKEEGRDVIMIEVDKRNQVRHDYL